MIDGITIVNLCGHDVTVVDEMGVTHKYPPSGIIARCDIKRTKLGYVKGLIPLNKTNLVQITGLPEPQKDTLYIVSFPVALYSKRNDLIVPDDTFGDEFGVKGCRGFATV